MDILRLTLGPYDTHTYLVKEGDFCAVIDPEINRGEIMDALRARDWTLTDILITHAHHDHVRGINDLPEGARLHIHEADAAYLPGRNEALGDPFYKPMEIGRKAHAVRDGDRIGPFTVMHVPGHSPGCALYVAPGHVFSGDSLFVGAYPMLGFTLGDARVYEKSLERMKGLDRGAQLHPGHGDMGTVGDALGGL